MQERTHETISLAGACATGYHLSGLMLVWEPVYDTDVKTLRIDVGYRPASLVLWGEAISPAMDVRVSVFEPE